MRLVGSIVVSGAAFTALGVSIYSVCSRPRRDASQPSPRQVEYQSHGVSNLDQREQNARDSVPNKERAAGDSAAPTEARLRVLEKSMAELRAAMDGVSLERASADRAALFAAEEGYLKADEYFEAGKYAIAGEGYLTFVQHHPNHPDLRGILKKARDAFLKANYSDKAFWVHEEMMKQFPQHRSNDLWEQAQLEKSSGDYAAAVKHAQESPELATNPEERLWRRSYWAWYVMLRDGNAAGVAALRQVQQEIAAGGFPETHRLAVKAREKLLEWQK